MLGSSGRREMNMRLDDAAIIKSSELSYGYEAVNPECGTSVGSAKFVCEHSRPTVSVFKRRRVVELYPRRIERGHLMSSKAVLIPLDNSEVVAVDWFYEVAARTDVMLRMPGDRDLAEVRR